MYAYDNSNIYNEGLIGTLGSGSHGMVASNDSEAWNAGYIVTSGDNAYGMYAYDNSEIYNSYFSPNTIETFGDGSHGMVADMDSFAGNDDEIITHGEGSFGMLAVNQ